MEKATGVTSKQIPWAWFFVLAGIILYIPFIGGVSLFDWDEINFAEISREMIVSGDYLNIQMDFQPFFEKPPFFFWAQVVCMKTFGINEFAARLPNALVGIITLVLLFKVGAKWIDKRFGVFWAISYMGSILPALYHKSGIIDPWFNLFIFGGLIAWVEGTRSKHATKWFLISGLLSGLAVLTKGPVGPLLIGLTVLLMMLLSKNKKFLPISGILLFIIGNCLVAGVWFGINLIANGPDFIMAFLKVQVELLTKSVAGHKGFPGYHFAVALLGVFPASIFAIAAFRKKQSGENADTFQLRLLMIILTAVVLILFSLVQSKIVHYSSMVYYPISFLSAWAICQFLDGKLKWKTWNKILGISIGVLICVVIIALPLVGQNIAWLRSTFTFDAFTLATLDAPVRWTLATYIPGIWMVSIFTVFVILWRILKYEYAFITLFAGIGLFVSIALISFIGRIEQYSQHAAIEFCASKAGQRVEIRTLGYKSYVPYFYAQKPAPEKGVNAEDLPHYYILKVDKRKRLEQYPNHTILYEKNGFIFFEE